MNLLEVVRKAIEDGGEMAPLARQFLVEVAGSSDVSGDLEWLREQLESGIAAAARVQGGVDKRGRQLGTELPMLVQRLRETEAAIAAAVQPEEDDPVDELQRRRDARQSRADVAGGAAERGHGGSGGG